MRLLIRVAHTRCEVRCLNKERKVIYDLSNTLSRNDRSFGRYSRAIYVITTGSSGALIPDFRATADPAYDSCDPYIFAFAISHHALKLNATPELLSHRVGVAAEFPDRVICGVL